MEGQQKLKAAKVLCVGTGGLGAPLALYLAAAGVGTLGLVDFDVVDASNLQRQIIHSTATVGKLKVDSAEIMLKGLNPLRERGEAQHHADQRQRARNLQGLRRHRRRHRQLPDPLPGQRRLRAHRQAQRLRLHLPLRGPGQRLRHRGRPMLPLPLSRTAAAGPGALVRGGWRARHSARPGRRHSGHRGHQADSRHRRVARRPAAADRCARHELPHAQAAQEPDCPACGTHEVKELIDYDQFCGIEKPKAVGPLEVARDKAVAEAPSSTASRRSLWRC